MNAAEHQEIVRANEIRKQMQEVRQGIEDVCIGLVALLCYCLLWVK